MIQYTSISLHLTLLLTLLLTFPVVGSERREADAVALQNLVISADGAWMAAEEHSDRGDGSVRVWSTEGDVTFSIERGQSPRISRDSRWVGAFQKPPSDDPKTTTLKNQRSGQRLVLLDLLDGSRKSFDFVLSFDMTYSSTYLLYLQSPEASGERTTGTLHQIPLNRDRLVQIGHRQPDWSGTTENVTHFATHPTNDHFSYVVRDDKTDSETLCICKWGIRARYQGDNIKCLCWAGGKGDESIKLGFISSKVSTDGDSKRRTISVPFTWQPGQSSAEKFIRVDTPK